MNEKFTAYETLGWMGSVGVLIALGQLLASNEKLTLRIIFGRALITLGLSVSAGAILLWVADPHPLALIGLSAGLASLGTGFLEMVLKKKLGIQP